MMSKEECVAFICVSEHRLLVEAVEHRLSGFSYSDVAAIAERLNVSLSSGLGYIASKIVETADR